MATASGTIAPDRRAANRIEPRRIRVMIVDDSIVARAVLARTLEAQRDFEVVAQAATGGAALKLLEKQAVDLILLDLEMPGMSGLDALPELIVRSGARILVVSSAAGNGAAQTLAALRLGAADTLLKPDAGGMSGGFSAELVDRLRRIAAAPDAASKPIPQPESAACPPPPPAQAPLPGTAMACLAVGASTGGVHALAAFFGNYPRGLAVPILVTQHLPPPFMPFYAAQLAELSGRRTSVAADGMPLAAGSILLAPGDAHLGLARSRNGDVHVRLERRPAASGCLPSVDPMLAAVAKLFGAAGVGVMLSGMGRDGLAGAEELAAAGGEILAQDAASSVVWGMPGAVVSRGLAAAVLPPRLLARRVAERAARGGAGAAWR